MQELFGNLWNLQWQQVVMWGIGGLLIWLAIKKEMEPALGFTSPAMARRVELLPAPLAPIRVTISPSGTSKEMPLTASMPP